MKKKSIISPGAKVAVLGLGISGRSAVRYAIHCGAEVYVSDCREESRFLAEEKEFLATNSVSWEAGGHSQEFLSQAEILLVSPGVDFQLPLLQQLRKDNRKVVGELAVVAGQVDAPLVAVTGTNGKTTVTTLIGEILRRSGKRVFVGGNIGTPLYEYLLNPASFDVVVAEVSSFQLESGEGFSPDVGLMLNISPDHLDRHRSMENYIQAKSLLFSQMTEKSLAIIDGDDPYCRQLVETLSTPVQSFGKRNDCTATLADGLIRLDLEGKLEEYQLRTTQQGDTIRLKNYAAASLATRYLGCTAAEVQAGLNAFELLPHRMEFVAEIDKVAYYNDSKATNTGAVIAALNQFQNRVILIAGGRDKGDDYSLLRQSVSSKVKKLVLIGEAANLFQEALADVVDIVVAGSLRQAVKTAANMSLPGDVVLLSPACASFDMFTSYGDRGAQFRQAVLDLRQET